MPRWTAFLVLVACAAAATACTGPDSSPSSPPAGSGSETAASDRLTVADTLAWRQEGARAVSDPAAVAGHFVAYTANHGYLYLTVFDPQTGDVVAGLNTSGANVTPGVGLHVAHDGPRVMFFERQHSLAGPVRLSGYDVRKRRVIWRTRPMGFNSQPGTCPGSDRHWCVTTWSEADEEVLWRIDPRTGKLRRLASGIGRPIGAGLYDQGTTIARVVDGKVRWRRTTRAMMGGPYDPDFGWAWDRYDDVLVGHFGRQVRPPQGRRWVSYPEPMTAGIDAATGRTLWTRRGDTDCLPWSVRPLVQCIRHGRIKVDDSRIIDRSKLTVTIARLDPQTGKPLWSLPPGRWQSVIDADSDWVVLANDEVAGWRTGTRTVAIDVGDGSVRKVAPDTVGWCDVSYDVSDRSSYLNDHRLARGQRPCRVDGEAATLPAFVSSDFGARVGDVFAWNGRRGLQAVRLVPSSSQQPA